MGLDWDKEECYKGHKGSVLTLAKLEDDPQQPLLASGSEDATVRLWDTRLGRTVKCFTGEGFDRETGVQALAFVNCNPPRLFAGSGDSLLELDLTSDRIICTQPRRSFPHAGDEEINQIHAHPKHHYLAMADDAGKVKILDISREPPTLFKILDCNHHHKKKKKKKQQQEEEDGSNQDPLCTAVLFRPRMPWDLAAGYLDCGIGLWDFSRGRARMMDTREGADDDGAGATNSSSSTVTGIQGSSPGEEESTSGTSSSRLFNPPFVHALAFTSDGRYLAAGLGDSTVAVYDYARAQRIGLFQGGHSSAVAHLHFLDSQGVEASSSSSSSNTLITAGNDQALCVWQLEEGEGVAGKGGKCGQVSSLRGGLRGRMEGLPGKPNWTLSVEGKIVVADTTTDISVFRLREG